MPQIQVGAKNETIDSVTESDLQQRAKAQVMGAVQKSLQAQGVSEQEAKRTLKFLEDNLNRFIGHLNTAHVEQLKKQMRSGTDSMYG